MADRLEETLNMIQERLEALSHRANAVFANCVSDRALSFCLLISKDPHQPEWDRAQIYVENIWKYLLDTGDLSEIQALSARMKGDMPSLVEDTSLPRILAQNLYVAIDVAISFCLGMNPGSIAGEFGIELLRAAVSHFKTGYADLGSFSTLDLEQKIEKHPFLVREIEFQLFDLRALERLSSLGPRDIEGFKSRASSSLVVPDDFSWEGS